MAPTVHFVRHAQGYHNLSIENEQIRDPDLTDLGHRQCANLRAAFPHHAQVTRLLASPIRRTLYTCLEAFGEPRLLPVTAVDLLQEVSDSPCDVGSDVDKLREEFGDKVDLGRVRDGWNDKKNPGSWAEPRVEKLIARAREARRAIRELVDLDGDEHIVVVTHGAIVHYITDEWSDIPDGRATSWTNCEYRSYQFVDPTGQDEDAELSEPLEFWRKRTGGEHPPAAAEMRATRAIMQKKLDPQLKVEA